VIGVEASEGQRNASVRAEGVVYLPGRAESLPLGENIAGNLSPLPIPSFMRCINCYICIEVIDLVTVAQAAHWFDLPKFFDEANRVLRPGSLHHFLLSIYTQSDN
jgi:SAM-dependent methyltransferase